MEMGHLLRRACLFNLLIFCISCLSVFVMLLYLQYALERRDHPYLRTYLDLPSLSCLYIVMH